MGLIYEKVYQVTHYYDGPREGIADFEGRPHLFKSERDYGANVFFFLTPLSEELFELAMGEKGETFCLVPDPVRQFRVRGRIRRAWNQNWGRRGLRAHGGAVAACWRGLGLNLANRHLTSLDMERSTVRSALKKPLMPRTRRKR